MVSIPCAAATAGTLFFTATASSCASIMRRSRMGWCSRRHVCRVNLLKISSCPLPDSNSQACLLKNGHTFFPFRTGALVFAHLHCHSHYSFLRGVASPEEIVAAAAEQNMPAVALTDTNGLYAAVLFYKAAQAAGIKPIVGVVLDVAWAQDQREIPRLQAPAGSGPSTRNASFERMSLVLLAADMEGYSNLCQLVTLRHLGTTKLSQNMNSAETDGRPVTLQELAEHNRGVIALCPLPARSRDTSTRKGTNYRAPTK